MTGDADGSRTELYSLAEVSSHGTSVAVGRLETPKGERLELVPPGGDGVRLDAVALECLAWQDRDRFEAFFGSLDGDARDGPSLVALEDPAETVELTSITNEFAHVDVRKLTTGDRDHLQLLAPKVGVGSTLTVRALERVAVTPQDRFTDLVRRRVE